MSLTKFKHQKESDIQKAIIDYLKLKKYVVFKHRNVGIYKKDSDRYIPLPKSELGISDIIGCSPSGKFLAIEVKKPGGKATDDQIKFIKSIVDNGGIGMIAYSIDDVMSKI